MKATLPSSAPTPSVESGTKKRRRWALTGRQLSEREQRDQREWETDGYGGVEWSSERCDGTRGPGRMSPGRQRWGFSACDGSTLKNTSAPFLPACALLPLTLSLLPSSIFYISRPISLFPHPLLSVPSSSCFLVISLPLSPPPPFLFSIDGTSSGIFNSGKSKKAIQSPFSSPFSLSPRRTAKILCPAVTFSRILTFRRNGSLRLILFCSTFVLSLECLDHKWLPCVSSWEAVFCALLASCSPAKVAQALEALSDL